VRTVMAVPSLVCPAEASASGDSPRDSRAREGA
jgi:hypothetical protein